MQGPRYEALDCHDDGAIEEGDLSVIRLARTTPSRRCRPPGKGIAYTTPMRARQTWLIRLLFYRFHEVWPPGGATGCPSSQRR